jgi:hypothetical protein
LSANELTTIDNQQWINVHIYVMKKWVWIPILLTFQDVEMGVATDNFTNIILQNLTKFKGFVE